MEEEKKTETIEKIPYIVHESSMARMERTVRRLWIALLLMIAVLFANNIAWLVYESQFDTYSYDQEGETNSLNFGDGDIINGETAFAHQSA